MTDTRDTILLAEALHRADTLAAALAVAQRERDAAVRTVTWDRAMLRRQRLLRFALCLSVGTSGILLMRVSTLPVPPHPPQIMPRAAVARPTPAPAAPFELEPVQDEAPGGAPKLPERPALPRVQRPLEHFPSQSARE